MTAPFYGMIEEVHVILVDHDKEFITKVTDLLESYGYKVTTVDSAFTAMSKLSKGKENFDVMIINVHSPDLHCFKLLEQAVALDIVSLFVCDEQNKLLVNKVVDYGAYVCLKKSLDKEIVKVLWQFVLWGKIRRDKARKGLEANGDPINVEDGGKKTVKQRKCTIWNLDLELKFMKALLQLGEGRCLPKDILEMMNVPGLTKMQVASHLQKCRKNNWRPPRELHYILQGSSSCSQQRTDYRKFGTMSHLQTYIPNQTERGPKLPPINTNIFSSSIQQQLYHPQYQVQPNYNNPLLSIQNNVGGGAIQQPFLGMLGSKGPTIGSTNYKPGMTFNIVDHHDYTLDHHTRNGYSLDLNVTTHPNSAMMSDAYVANATSNGLGATNANIQQYIDEQNMFYPSNIVASAYASDIEESDLHEMEDCDAYINFDNMDDLFCDFEPPTATLPNEHGIQFNQDYSGDKVTATSSVQFPEIAKFSDDSSK